MSEVSSAVSEVAKSGLDSVISVSKWLAILYGAFTVIAILMGGYYHKGWLTTYGLNTDLFPISIQDSLILSHQAFLSLASRSFQKNISDLTLLMPEAIFSGVFIFCLLIFVFFILPIWHKRSELGASPVPQDTPEENSLRADEVRNSDPLTGWAQKNRGLSALGIGVITSLAVYFGPRFIIAIVFTLGFVPAIGYLVAVSDAKEAQIKSECTGSAATENPSLCDVLTLPINDVSSKKTSRKYYGNIISSNEKWVAISVKSKTLVFPIDGAEMEFRQPH